MLERNFDPTKPYGYACYGRMSDPRQNKRSPEQQFNTIEETLARCGYPWIAVRTYRDDGISGQYLRKRPGLQRLLRDIEAGLITIDLIVVDTLERLGRAEEIGELRRKLIVEHGIMVVAADNNFCDPTGPVGKAVGMMEQMRSTENTRISRHNVIRGKKDAARLRRWPGGPPAFGYKLKLVVDESVSPAESFNVLEPEPREAAAMLLAFQRAASTGEGDVRLSNWWNTSPAIPNDFKPVNSQTLGRRLDNRIYLGVLIWGANRTGVVDDTRVVEPNPDGAEVIPNFCPPIISNDLFEAVQKLRKVRSQRLMDSRKSKAPAGDGTKLIAPQLKGLTLKYLLTGLVRCGCCGASMRPTSSGRTSKAGRRYIYYGCPRYYEGACPNARYVDEGRLREAVVGRVRARLFPQSAQLNQTPEWLPEIVALVRQELQRFQVDEPNRAAIVEQEMKQLDKQISGWMISLGDPELPPGVRKGIQENFAKAQQRLSELKQTMAAEKAQEEHLQEAIEPKVVIENLHRLDKILPAHNPTLGNLELGKHIDKIVCFPNGTVELRGTYLGIFAGAVELLSRHEGPSVEAVPAAGTTSCTTVTPQRRGRLRLPTLSTDAAVSICEVDSCLDPNRFSGLPQQFFWKDSFVVDHIKSWSEENASEVARLRASGMTHDELAVHFGKTIPTIRKALGHAIKLDESVGKLPKKMPRSRWAEEHAAEVAQLRTQGLSTDEIAFRFGKSDTTIRAALAHAKGKTVSEPNVNEGTRNDDHAVTKEGSSEA